MRLVVLMGVIALPLSSAYAEDSKTSTITVHGEAETKVTPDQASLPVTISSDNKDLNTAKKENDEKLQKLLQIASDYGIAKEDMQTEYSGIQPKYVFGQNITTQTDVYSGNVSFNIDVTGLAQDKIDNFTEALEKAGLSNIGNNHHNDTIHVTANFNDRNADIQELHKTIKEKEDEITAIINKFGIDKSRVTRNEFVNKGKESHSDSPKQHINGYHSTVNVNFTIKDKDKVTPFINALVKEGVDNIGNVSFNLSNANEKKTKDETLLKALKNAGEKAQALAAASGMTLGSPLTIDEGMNSVQPPPFRPYPVYKKVLAMEALKGAPMMDEAELPSGQTEIHQTVTVTYQIK